jgi:hypothetical protein
VGLTVPSYFSGRWGQNLCGQTTIRKCGASAMHSPKIPEELGGCGTCATRPPTHWYMSVEVFLEVATLDILMPLMMALDGGATVFPTTTTVDFLPEVCRRVARHRWAMLHRWWRILLD